MLNLDYARRKAIEEQLRDSYVLVLGSTPSHRYFYNGDTLGELTREGRIRGYHFTPNANEALTRVLSHNHKEGNLIVIVHDSFRMGKPCNVRRWVVQEAKAAHGVYPIHFDGKLLPDRTQNSIYVVEKGVVRVLSSSRTMEPCPEHLARNILPLAYLHKISGTTA